MSVRIVFDELNRLLLLLISLVLLLLLLLSSLSSLLLFKFFLSFESNFLELLVVLLVDGDVVLYPSFVTTFMCA
jgi:hypothetical protein